MKARLRNSKGTALAEGVVGLLLVVTGMILATILVFNVGAASLNRDRIGFVANQAAIYAASLPDNGSRQGLVSTRVDELLTSTGLTGANRTVNVSSLQMINRDAVKVTVAVTFPTYLSTNFTDIVPRNFQMADSAVALKEVPYWGYGVGVHPLGMRFTGPIVNATGALPPDNLPAYNVLVPVNMTPAR